MDYESLLILKYNFYLIIGSIAFVFVLAFTSITVSRGMQYVWCLLTTLSG